MGEFPCGFGLVFRVEFGQSTPRDLEILHFCLFISHFGGKPQDLVQKVEVFAHGSGEDLPALECWQTLRALRGGSYTRAEICSGGQIILYLKTGWLRAPELFIHDS